MRGASAKRMWFSISAENLARVLIRKAKAAADFCSDGDADFYMSVETDAVRRDAEGGGLADVVQQRSPGERERAAGWKLFEEKQSVDEDISFGMELRRLLNALHAGDLRQHFGEEACLVEQLESAAGLALRQHLGQLVADAFAADGRNAWGEGAHCSEGRRLNSEAEARGKANGTEQAKLIFLKPPHRIADGAQNAGVEIGQAADMIDDCVAQRLWIGADLLQRPTPTQWAAQGIEQEAVDGEVAALDVFGGVEGVADLVGMAAIGVRTVGAKGRDLHLRWGGLLGGVLGLGGNENDAEVRADSKGAREHVEHDVGRG